VRSFPKHRRILGENIRVSRKQSGISQEKLAEKADLNTTYISDVERGEENISVDALVRIANALKVPLADLIRGI
jgi:transcriptional regulator with XRE-family HTH domain